jgi:hypothetical protein
LAAAEIGWCCCCCLLTLVTVDTDWLVVVLLPLMMMAMLVLLMLPLRTMVVVLLLLLLPYRGIATMVHVYSSTIGLSAILPLFCALQMAAAVACTRNRVT